MNTTMRVTNPDTIEIELTVTMPLKAWKELDKQLPNAWPAFRLSEAINDMVSQATKQFYPKPTPAEDFKTLTES